MKEIYFSIIVPVYNCEDCLEKCINSILNQTYKFFELILVNDASSDNSLDIINSFDDDRIIVINKEKNTGASDSRNIGISLAQNEYICFFDSDDYVENNILETYVSIINKYDPEMISCGIYSEVSGKMDCLYSVTKYFKNKKSMMYLLEQEKKRI